LIARLFCYIVIKVRLKVLHNYFDYFEGLYGKNDFTEGSKILLDTDMNNFVEPSK